MPPTGELAGKAMGEEAGIMRLLVKIWVGVDQDRDMAREVGGVCQRSTTVERW